MATRSLLVAAFLLALALLAGCHGMTIEESGQLREQVREMFFHTYDGYMRDAFPLDELKPISCTGEDTLGGYALTLVDAMDTLALLGNQTEFSRAVGWVVENVHFDIDKTVSVFETNIRILGGLLSSHLLASDAATGVQVDGYQGGLLSLARDLAHRMLPAFKTPTGIPYGSVHLQDGVSHDESTVTSTAGGGTLVLEFATLSRLTGERVFEDVALRAVRGIWSRRSQLGLVGAHIDVITGEWTHKDAGIGTSIDSFYEYLLKAHLLLGGEEYLHIYNTAYAAATRHLKKGPWYVEVNMDTASLVWPLFNALQAFWPGLQALAGDLEPARESQRAFHSVWRRYGYTPEGFNLQHDQVHPGQASYPLRPELIESTYLLHRATGDPQLLAAGRDMLHSLQRARTECGYAMVEDVATHGAADSMESFFLAETLKYLWLLFDSGAAGPGTPGNLIDGGPYPYVFTTEGHPLPIRPDISGLYTGSHAYHNHARGGGGGGAAAAAAGRRRRAADHSAETQPPRDQDPPEGGGQQGGGRGGLGAHLASWVGEGRRAAGGKRPKGARAAGSSRSYGLPLRGSCPAPPPPWAAGVPGKQQQQQQQESAPGDGDTPPVTVTGQPLADGARGGIERASEVQKEALVQRAHQAAAELIKQLSSGQAGGGSAAGSMKFSVHVTQGGELMMMMHEPGGEGGSASGAGIPPLKLAAGVDVNPCPRDASYIAAASRRRVEAATARSTAKCPVPPQRTWCPREGGWWRLRHHNPRRRPPPRRKAPSGEGDVSPPAPVKASPPSAWPLCQKSSDGSGLALASLGLASPAGGDQGDEEGGAAVGDENGPGGGEGSGASSVDPPVAPPHAHPEPSAPPTRATRLNRAPRNDQEPAPPPRSVGARAGAAHAQQGGGTGEQPAGGVEAAEAAPRRTSPGGPLSARAFSDHHGSHSPPPADLAPPPASRRPPVRGGALKALVAAAAGGGEAGEAAGAPLTTPPPPRWQQLQQAAEQGFRTTISTPMAASRPPPPPSEPSPPLPLPPEKKESGGGAAAATRVQQAARAEAAKRAAAIIASAERAAKSGSDPPRTGAPPPARQGGGAGGIIYSDRERGPQRPDPGHGGKPPPQPPRPSPGDGGGWGRGPRRRRRAPPGLS